MMTHKFLYALAALALSAGSALAAPSLRGDITVTAAIVTVGDMFDDAGSLSELALFRAPAPGTTGIVGLDQVSKAAARIGLAEFQNVGLTRVRVERAATVIDATMLSTLVDTEMKSRALLTGGATAEIHFDNPNLSFNAEAVDNPVSITNLRYRPDTGAFGARFTLAGIDQPVDVTGQVDLMVKVPQLVSNTPAGTILQPSDLELRLVPQNYAEAAGFAPIDQLVGKQLLRQSQAGMLLKISDVSAPTAVRRNTTVTVYFRSGAMTLTVKGQSLNSASAGEPVAVMNTLTKKILHGTALANGAVEITSDTLNVAGL